MQHYVYPTRATNCLSALLLSFLCCATLLAQSAAYRRTVIPTLSQLPVNALNCIFQDSEGYMWYGTVDGLCRDDGYGIHTFRNDFLTPELIQINLVQAITEDARHRIWFATHKGLYILDKSNYAIRQVDIPGLRDVHVDKVMAAGDGQVYAWHGATLYQVTLDGRLAATYRLPGPINDLYEDSRHRLLASVSPMGLCVRQPGGKRFVTVNGSVRAMSVCEDHSRRFLWLAAYDEKIYKIPLDGRCELTPQTIAGDQARGTHSFIQIVQDGISHHLWLRTTKGLVVLSPGPGNTLTSLSDDDGMSRQNMLLSCLSVDRQGNVWVGGFDTPSFYVQAQRGDRMGYVGPVIQAQTRYAPAIVTLCRDDGGHIWYYQEGNGLYFYNPATEKITSYRDCPSTAGEALGVVPYLVRSRQPNSIWASTLGDVYLLQRSGETMVLRQRVAMESHVRKTGNVESIYEDRAGNLWVSTMRGLYVWRPATRRVEVLSETIGDISDFTETTDGHVWATIRNRGIARLDAKGRIKVYPHDIDFTSLDASRDGHLWLGTGEGRVLEFVPSHPDRLEDWTARCGMNGDMVDHIAVDNLGHVWVTTNQRVREFNPRNGAFRMLKTADEDVPLNRFLPRAVYFDKPTATMYLGGIPGYVMLKPSRALEHKPKPIRTVVSDVRVGGRSVWLTPGRRGGADRIDIMPGETNLSLSFTTLDYANRSRVNYAYRLEGVDKDWNYLTDGQNVARYNKLAKGTYVLEVKATDENGLWSNRVTQFTIHQLPAWYETWLAYTLYIMAFLAIVGLLGRLYLNWHKEMEERQMVENLLKAKQMQIAAGRLHADSAETGDGAAGPEKTVRSGDTHGHPVDVRVSNVRSFDEEFVAKATKIVEQNLANAELSVVFLASELGMSRSTFMRKIKAVTGQTPLDFIKSIKLKHAYAMLEDKTATIQDVMRAVGYNDRKTFSQSFKEAFNITPVERQHKA